MPIPYPGASVRYVDRWQPEENLALFTNLEVGATFPKPDIVANLDVDRLSALADESQDFVIASHLLEHLADPLTQIAEIHRVLKPGGVVTRVPSRSAAHVRSQAHPNTTRPSHCRASRSGHGCE